MKSKFQNIKFKTKSEFQEWLKASTFLIIDLKDNGQDMQRIWVHKTGEILNCDFNSSIYNGQFTDILKLAVGKPLTIFNNDKTGFIIYHKLIIDSITNIQL